MQFVTEAEVPASDTLYIKSKGLQRFYFSNAKIIFYYKLKNTNFQQCNKKRKNTNFRDFLLFIKFAAFKKILQLCS